MLPPLRSGYHPHPFWVFLTIKPTVRTVIMGPIEAKAKTPNPSIAPVFEPMPNPIARTKGTVMGPVVTCNVHYPNQN